MRQQIGQGHGAGAVVRHQDDLDAEAVVEEYLPAAFAGRDHAAPPVGHRYNRQRLCLVAFGYQPGQCNNLRARPPVKWYKFMPL